MLSRLRANSSDTRVISASTYSRVAPSVRMYVVGYTLRTMVALPVTSPTASAGSDVPVGAGSLGTTARFVRVVKGARTNATMRARTLCRAETIALFPKAASGEASELGDEISGSFTSEAACSVATTVVCVPERSPKRTASVESMNANPVEI